MRAFAPDRPARRLRALGAGYSRTVGVLKIVLPALALVMLGIVVVRLSKDPFSDIASATPKDERAMAGQIVLDDAQYDGVDDEGRAYTLIAKHANRDPGNEENVLLDDVKADITLENDTWLALHAQTGAYDTKARTLTLAGDVSAFHDSGYEMRLEDLFVDMKTRAAETKHPVRAQGPAGEIAAMDMRVLDNGARLVFSGPATLKFYRLGGAG